MTAKKELSGKAKTLLAIHFLCIAVWGLATFLNAWGLADAGALDYSFFYPWIEGAKSGSWFSIFYIIYSIIIWLCLAIALPVILYAILLKFHLKISKKVLGFAILLSVIAFLVILVSELFGAGYEPYHGIPSTRTNPVELDKKSEERSKDANNLEGCPVLFELGKWELSEHTLDLSRMSNWYKKRLLLQKGNEVVLKQPFSIEIYSDVCWTLASSYNTSQT